MPHDSKYATSPRILWLENTYSLPEVIRTTSMISLKPESLISASIARRNQGIMRTTRRIFGQNEHWPRVAAEERVISGRCEFQKAGMCVGHGKIFVAFGGVEGPEVDDLFAVAIDDFKGLVLVEGDCYALTGREELES